MANFTMPSLGADMDEGTLLEWLVKPGDDVRKGDIIAVVDTAKAAVEVESFATGTVERLIVGEGEVVPVGTVLAIIAEHAVEAGAAPPQAKPVAEKVAETVAPAKAPAAKKAPAKKAPAKKAPAKKAPAKKAGRKPVGKQPAGTATTGPWHAETASPLVRHLAGELGVDLSMVNGTGRAGAITRADVERAHAVPQARQHVTPFARRIAAELSVDLASVTGSGPDGAVRADDVRHAAEAGLASGAPAAAAATTGAGQAVQAVQAAPAQRSPKAPSPRPASESSAATSAADRMQAMRQVTARLMARSKREIPHYYLSETIDLSRAMTWLHDRNRELEVTERLVPAALLLKAAAAAARQVPQLNGFWTDDHFVAGDAVHLGVAISLRGGGLVTPAIHDAADLAPLELMTALRDLVTRARTGRLRGSELTDATITVTNLGDQGVEVVYGVIYPPQVALVGFGKVAERPVAIDGLVGARPVVMTTLAADHRATDGYTGARFLSALSDLLQHPEEM